MKLTFYDYMRASHVKRWHTVHTAYGQTLAEHSFMVTVIAMELYQKIVGFDDHDEVLQLMAGAMFHDMPEVRMGDTPTPAKVFIREHAGDVYKEMEEKLMPEIPYVGGRVPKQLTPFIKMADLIADAWWMAENKMGVHSDMVAKANSRIMADHAIKLEETDPTAGWLKTVNEVLMELGMPYLSVSLRLTPP